jgi:hypothetical protein
MSSGNNLQHSDFATLYQCQDAMVTPAQRMNSPCDESVTCIQPIQFPFRGHQSKPTTGGYETRRRSHRYGHFIDRPDSHTIKPHLQELGSGGMYDCGDAQGTDGLLQESRLLTLRFGQRDRYFRAAERDGNSRKSGSGTKIKQRGYPLRQQTRTLDRFKKMARENARRIADRRQIHPCVPADKKIQVGFQFANEIKVRLRNSGFNQQLP